jgi:hypothetical protein
VDNYNDFIRHWIQGFTQTVQNLAAKQQGYSRISNISPRMLTSNC